ncbi:L-fucose:H+ symporter permease [Dysgonomonas sp. Marseille-P4677]|uniref:L-fucose:H+ symporter permease n=1 Tax=Dysgonomonas sp. Marseille-P4677 TaxID=2364790 RepID=UPI0019147C04|nr:L-fucose:H+ symporter permease [Dysgonomonas sp. Marseille-P4677]MBK5722358.1 L-fucose:H+ symporter permease [Dysgonomonas sp. Marseille-P4677]
MNTTKNKYAIPLALIFSLFFIWAISSNLLPTMIRQLMKTCELNTFEASFTETAYWLAYFIFPIPIAMFMKRYSYKAGIVFGLFLAALGGLLFFPASIIKEYWAYLGIFFIIATGMCFLETAANPYVTALGDPKTSSRRLNLAQSFNGLGAFIAAMFLSKLVLSGHQYTRETIPADYVGGWEGYIQFETDAMKLPYLILGIVLVIIAIVFIFSHLPKIKEGEYEEGEKGTDKLIDFKVLKRSHLRWGVIAQFFYNGGQTAINSLFLVYCCTYAGMAESTATTFFGLYMLAFLAGRWIGTLLMVKFKPQNMLVVYALANIILCGVIMTFGGVIGLYAMLGVSFFMSIMYPTQFSLALKDLGSNTKSGSAFLVMAIVGNACLPQLTAYIMHQNEHVYQIAYIIPLICFIFCAHYGWKGYKVID